VSDARLLAARVGISPKSNPRPAGPDRVQRSGPLLEVTTTVRDNARRAAVISSPVLSVVAVAATGVLGPFSASWRRYLNTVSAAGHVQFLFSLRFFEFNS